MDTLKVLILGVSKYNFQEDGGRQVSGVTVHFVQLTPSATDDKVGFFPTKASFSDLAVFDQFRGQEFPLSAEASWSLDMSNKRQPIKITGFHKLETALVG